MQSLFGTSLVRLFALSVMLVTASAEAQTIMVNIQSPTFWTCTAPPPPPPNSPMTSWTDITEAAKAMCGATQTSGRAMMVTLQHGAAGGGGGVVTQNVWLAGERDQNCTGNPTPYLFELTEYFSSNPAFDLHAAAFCCEMWVSETASMLDAFLPMAPGAQAIAPDEKANYPYPPGDGAAYDAIHRKVADNATANWGYHYEYDGCHPKKPQTFCKSAHCMNTFVQPRPLGGHPGKQTQQTFNGN
jgi:hypothetical protein